MTLAPERLGGAVSDRATQAAAAARRRRGPQRRRAALAALLGTAETMLGPVWVALLHGEVPQARTVIGGVFILVALMGYLMAEMHRQSRPMQKILPPVI